MNEKHVFSVATLVLIGGAIFVAQGIEINPNILLFPSRTLINVVLSISLPLTLVLVAIIAARYVSPKTSERVVVWAVALAEIVLLSMYFKIDPVVSVMLAATWFSALFSVVESDPCGLRIKNLISRPKLLATLIIILFAVNYYSVYKEDLKNAYIEQAIALITPEGNVDLNTAKLLNAEVTPKEMADLRHKLEELNWWNQLTPEDQEKIFKEQLQIYADTKKAITEVLSGNIYIAGANAEDLLRKQIEEVPLMKKVLDNIHYIVAFSVAIIYSFTSLLAELVAWIIGAIIAGLLGPFPGQKKIT